jgi:phosphohistidine phosphatase
MAAQEGSSMDLLIVRHALAMEHEDWAKTGRPESERPLTKEGKSRMKHCAAGLVRVAPGVELVATSPFTRAAETAAIVIARYEKVERAEVECLASGGSQTAVLDWLAKRDEKCLAIVGHEPDLGLLVGRLLTGRESFAVPLRKAGACLLRFGAKIAAGKAELRWFMPPSVLEKIGS